LLTAHQARSDSGFYKRERCTHCGAWNGSEQEDGEHRGGGEVDEGETQAATSPQRPRTSTQPIYASTH